MRLIVHHSASLVDTIESIYHEHVNVRKFNNIGYHFIIDREGQVRTGRGLVNVSTYDFNPGAHCLNNNRDSIGVCLLGDFTQGWDFNTKQFQSTLRFVRDLMRSYQIDIKNVFGHNEKSNTLCPGFDMDLFRSELNKLSDK